MPEIVFWFFGGLIGYFIPTLIVLLRNYTKYPGWTLIINLLFGWSGIGWIIAFILSLKTDYEAIERDIEYKNNPYKNI